MQALKCQAQRSSFFEPIADASERVYCARRAAKGFESSQNTPCRALFACATDVLRRRIPQRTRETSDVSLNYRDTLQAVPLFAKTS